MIPSQPAEASVWPSGAKAKARTAPVCPVQSDPLLARGRVPEPYVRIEPSGGQGPAVGGERDRIDRSLVLQEPGLPPIGRYIPEHSSLVLAARGQGPAVGGERHGIDLVSVPSKDHLSERVRLLLLRARHEMDRYEDEARQESRQPAGKDRHPDRTA